MTAGVLDRREITVRGLRISYLVKGSTGPVTLYVHGLGADAEQTRPLASGVPGRCVLIDLPSHGASSDVPDRIMLADLVEIARTVADAEEATQALGVSLGSAVLLRWLITHPEDLSRVVLYLPAAVTEPRPAGRLRAALATEGALRAYVAGELPDHVARTPLAQRWMSARSAALGRGGITAYAQMLEGEPPLDDPSRAARVRTELLAIGARGDGLHPAEAAVEAARCFPRASAQVFDEAAPLWTSRRELRRIISGFLSGSDTVGA